VLAEESLPLVAVEWQQISHVFSNLIHNAVKHSPGEEVVVKAAREDGGIRFSVTDKGPGIPPKYQPYLFEKFYRVPGAERTGAGLGLSIAREIVRAHHGSIGVKSVPGQGAEFYFDIPFYDGAPSCTTARPGCSPAQVAARATNTPPDITMDASILVVDDERNVRLMYRAALDSMFKVDEADSAAKALEMFLARRYDVAILDLRMPEMTGLELLEQMNHAGITTPSSSSPLTRMSRTPSTP
jgi:CheY-like chemotaxis protein